MEAGWSVRVLVLFVVPPLKYVQLEKTLTRRVTGR